MKYFLALLFFIIFAQCAKQTSPSGGPQDKKPPLLIASTPTNNQKKFTSKTIELAFDEYIKLKNPNEEVMISPSIEKEIKYIAKKNKVIINTSANWKENTTYSIAFREAIQDITESNPTTNLRLAFSTGETIDSLQINGTIAEFFKEEMPDKITVALYTSDTFNIFKHTPIYFTKSDKKGNFSIQNLKSGEYYIYAFDDKNKNLLVESKTERFGFKKDKIKIPQKDSVHIDIFKVDTRPIKVTSFRSSEKVAILRINKALLSINVQPKLPNQFVYYFGKRQDEIIFRNLREEKNKDSIKLNVTLYDSTLIKKDTCVYLKYTQEKMIKEKWNAVFLSPQYDITKKTIQQKIEFNKPIHSINFDSIIIQIDTTHFQNITKKDITFDTLHLTLTLTTTLEKESNSPIVIYGKGSFVSIDQDSTSAKIENIRILKPDQTGTLSIKIETKEPYYFIELINQSYKPIQKISNVKEHIFKNLEPGEFKLRITIDSNNNQKWDTGNYMLRSEPEKIILYKTFDGKASTPVRANWEVGPLLIKF